MATEIVPFAREHLPLVQRFAERTWQRPRSAAFYRWRYEDVPGCRAFLALHDGECLAMCCAFERPYRLGDEIVPFLETFDWYTAPGLRNAGLGVRVIQRFMAEKEPLILVGGSDDARSFLARLRWRHAGDASRFTLPLRGSVTSALRRRLHVPERGARLLATAAGIVSRPRTRGRPRNGRVIPVAVPGAELDELYGRATPYGTLALWTQERLRWMIGGFAGAGHFVPLYFAQGDDLVGFALLRIFGTATGRSAELVDLFCPTADPALYEWIVSEIACLAAGFDADLLGATTTCPVVERALLRNRFRPAGAIPIHVWTPDRPGLPTPMLLGSNTRDTPLNPYVTHWWGDPART